METDLTQPTIESIVLLMQRCRVDRKWIQKIMRTSENTVYRVIKEPNRSHDSRRAVHQLLYEVYLAIQDNIPERAL